MILKYGIGIFFFLMVLTVSVLAQDEDFQSSLNYKVDKMKKELSLTESQAAAIGPIIKEYLTKRSTILQEVAGEGVVDHVSVKATLKALKEEEYQKLNKVFSADQMKEWINRENLMASLNPDGVESTIDDGPSLSADGANFKF